METRKKLEEARFFLEEFRKSVSGVAEKESSFYLSAFLSAWRSVLDVMLYDFAEYYSLGLTREDRMIERDFFIVAKAKSKGEALRFLKWWKKKIQRLSRNKLWNMRRIIIHRGYPEITQLYVPESMSSGCTISLGIAEKADAVAGYITDGRIVGIEYTILPEECKNAFKLMEDIIIEAERKFSVKL